MKMIRCDSCGDAVALSVKGRKCHCEKSGGRYITQKVVEIYGPCVVYGVDNAVFTRGRAEAFRMPDLHPRVIRRDR